MINWELVFTFSFLFLGFYNAKAGLIGLFLLTDWFRPMYGEWYWLILGFFFLPHTTLWVGVVVHFFHGEWNFMEILVLLAALAWDIAARLD